MQKPITLALALCASLFSLRCTESVGPETVSGPPSLPSEATMTIPALEGVGAAKQGALAKVSGLNHGAAALTVGFWTGIVAVKLIAPAALFKHVHETQPIALPDSGGWQWIVGHNDHQAILTGIPQGGQTKWAMTLTGEGNPPFTWYTGTSSTDGKTGDWIFYDKDDAAAKYRFAYVFTNSTEDVKAEVVDQNDSALGSSLHWKVDKHIRSFEAFDAPKDETVVITWNTITGAGKMHSQRDNNTHCWDGKLSGYADIFCDSLTLE